MPTEDARDRFLSVFRGETRNNVVEFCKHLWEYESDYYIFMARKAACFFDCLKQLGLADVQGVVLNDRALDMDVSFLRNKRVTLVDDCIFSGTTLRNARLKALEAGCAECNTLALAINEESIRPELLPGAAEAELLSIVGPNFLLRDSECVGQCNDVTRALSIFPAPYDVDFPHTRTVKIKYKSFNRLLNLPGWSTSELTSRFQRDNGVRVFTYIPAAPVIDKFTAMYNGQNGALETAKIRLYARELKPGVWSLRIVPFILLGALEPAKETRAIFNEESVWGADPIAYGLSGRKAQYRFQHFVFSCAFLDNFLDYVVMVGVDLGDLPLRADLIDMSYGEGFAERNGDKIRRYDGLSLPDVCAEPADTYLDEFPVEPKDLNYEFEIPHRCFWPYRRLYREREVATREYVKSHGLDATPNSEFEHLNRLLEGYTPRRLRAEVHSDSYDMDGCVSLALDRAIDCGIAVPTIYDNGDVCCRAFRHGEDAVLEDAHERLILLAIKAYMKEMGQNTIWKMELYKVIVLFMQIATRRSLIEPISELGSALLGKRVFTSKGHLHGLLPMVGVVEDPSGSLGPPYLGGHFDRHSTLVDEWVADEIVSENVQPGRGTEYCISDRLPKQSLGLTEDAEARRIGRTLGRARVLKNDLGKLLVNGDKSLVMLTTCCEPDHQVKALSGELKIVHDRWMKLISDVRAASKAGEYAEAERILRVKYDLFTAVNSGAMKYLWFIENENEVLINAVHEKAGEKDDDDLQDSWQVLWPIVRHHERTNTKRLLWDNIGKSGRWLLSANIALRAIGYWLLMRHGGESDADKERRDKSRGDLIYWCEKVARHYGKKDKPSYVKMSEGMIDSVREGEIEDIKRWVEESGVQMNRLAGEVSINLTEEATIICESYGKSGDLVPLPYALYIEVSEDDAEPREISSSFETVLRIIGETGYPDAYFLDMDRYPWGGGLWIMFGGNRNSLDAAKMSKHIASELNESNRRFRGVLFGQLPREHCVRILKGSSAISCRVFCQNMMNARDVVLPAEHDNSIVVVCEADETRPSESEKYEKVGGEKARRRNAVITGSGNLPDIEYTISKHREGGNVRGEDWPEALLKKPDPFRDSESVLSWIHYSDRHYGCGQEKYWPNLEDELTVDAKRVWEMAGKPEIDTILFTGDLVQRGDAALYKDFEATMGALWKRIEVETDSKTAILAVPGNHDLDWRDPVDKNVAKLLQYVDDGSIQEEFLTGEGSPMRRTVNEAFAEYEAWRQRQAGRWLGKSVEGILPGEFSTVYEKNGVRFGFVGLNSAYLQLVDPREITNPKHPDEPYLERLSLDVRQIDSVCGGSVARWAREEVDVAFLMTHHPRVWLSPNSQDEFESEIYTPGRFAAHICGHMHEHNQNASSSGGAVDRNYWQGISLFGFERKFGKVDRRHGYTIGQAVICEGEVRIRLWPRTAVKKQGKYWKIGPDATAEFEPGTEHLRTITVPINL